MEDFKAKMASKTGHSHGETSHSHAFFEGASSPRLTFSGSARALGLTLRLRHSLVIPQVLPRSLPRPESPTSTRRSAPPSPSPLSSLPSPSLPPSSRRLTTKADVQGRLQTLSILHSVPASLRPSPSSLFRHFTRRPLPHLIPRLSNYGALLPPHRPHSVLAPPTRFLTHAHAVLFSPL